MIKHVVLIKIKNSFDQMSKLEICKELKKRLDALPTLIEEIKGWETGINESKSGNAFDVALLSDFETHETLDIYRLHKEHVKILQYINEIKEDVKVVDYSY